MLDYKLIEALALVMEEGGFEKAAQRLCLTQSAISQRIRQLEDRSGQVLLTRSAPPRTTEAGRQLLKHYHQVKLLEEGLAASFDTAHGPSTLAIAINADSLASWFIDALLPQLASGDILIDLHVDDQEQTLLLLREGTVIGCVSEEPAPMQGCRVTPLGSMVYRLLATPSFARTWFPDGLTAAGCEKAPAVLFNRKDNLHHRFLKQALDTPPAQFPRHYIPSPEAFVDVIAAGCCYGMVPDWQGTSRLRSGTLAEILPGETCSVDLYWHCWNLTSEKLQRLSRHLVEGARRLLH